ncbi:MAG: glycosyl hydrolase [Verrucomicrobiales bacterium]|jgi:beta-N-acetylhexosaminidase|nr:glycosyl hydrolase [Verrucomicrobiales bacterium]
MASNLSGQPILMGLPGPSLSAGTRALIGKIQPGGFILFGRNIASPRQLFNLISELYQLSDNPPIITIDQEGGRVSRLRLIGEEPPSADLLRRAADRELIREHGELTGRLLALFGFNLNLAPVVDYAPDADADNSLRGRCYGATPREVIVSAGIFLDAMKTQGVLGTAKHFPGYTHCGIDPHGELPRVDRTLAQINAEELGAFRAFTVSADAFMVGHAHFPAWHDAPHPASLSQKIIHNFLIKELGYQGLIMTDDLEMGAVAIRYGAKRATQLAIAAGEHMVMFCHNPACAEIAHDTLTMMTAAELRPSLSALANIKEKLCKIPEKFDARQFREINARVSVLRGRAARLAAVGAH